MAAQLAGGVICRTGTVQRKRYRRQKTNVVAQTGKLDCSLQNWAWLMWRLSWQAACWERMPLSTACRKACIPWHTPAYRLFPMAPQSHRSAFPLHLVCGSYHSDLCGQHVLLVSIFYCMDSFVYKYQVVGTRFFASRVQVYVHGV